VTLWDDFRDHASGDLVGGQDIEFPVVAELETDAAVDHVLAISEAFEPAARVW
jgi:hypothetical protein